jgi:SAM-dependent methyltransferase
MIELLEPLPGRTILEVAAGPGAVGFELLPRIQPGGELISTDAAPEMVDVARREAAARGLDGVTFAVEDAAALSLADDSVDAVLCRWGLMLVPEMERAAAEMARVTRPGGRVVLAVWASPARNPWMTAAGKAALDLGFTDPPEKDAPGPFRLADPEALRRVVEGGGLEIEVIEEVPVTWAASIEEWWSSTQDVSRMLTELLSRLSDEQSSELRRVAEAHLEQYVQPDGSLVVPGVTRVVAATAPA